MSQQFVKDDFKFINVAYPDLFQQVIASEFETKPTLNPASWISDLLREMRGNSRSIDL